MEVKKGRRVKGKGKASRKYEREQDLAKRRESSSEIQNHSGYKVAHHLKLPMLRDSVSLAPWLGKRERGRGKKGG